MPLLPCEPSTVPWGWYASWRRTVRHARTLSTLAVQAVNCSLGQVCKLETYCATCEDTVNSCRASRQLFARAGMQVGDVLCDMRGHCQLLPCDPSTVPWGWYASWRRTVRHARTLSTLAVRSINCSLGLVCKLETYSAVGSQ